MFLVDLPVSSIWHGRLGYLSKSVIMHLSRAGYISKLSFFDHPELWSGKTPDYGKLRIFGCESYVLVPKDDRWKLESRLWKCIFLCYGLDGRFGYKLWDQESR